MQWQNPFYIYNLSKFIFSRQRFPVIFFLRHIQVTSLLICNHRLCVSGIIYFFPISTNFTIPVFLIKYHPAILVSTPPGFFLAFPAKFGNFIHLTRFSHWFFPLLFHKVFDKQIHENHQRPKVPQHSKSRNSHYLRSHVCGADNTGADQKCHDPKTKHDVPD